MPSFVSRMILLSVITGSLYFNGVTQNTCDSALFIESDSLYTICANDSVFWMAFIAEDSAITVQIMEFNNIPIPVSKMEAFDGPCSFLSLIDSTNESYINLFSLMPDTNFFIKLSLDTFTGSFSLYLSSPTKPICGYTNSQDTQCCLLHQNCFIIDTICVNDTGWIYRNDTSTYWAGDYYNLYIPQNLIPSMQWHPLGDMYQFPVMFNTPGIYEVQYLYKPDSLGVKDTCLTKTYISVYGDPELDIIAYPDSVCPKDFSLPYYTHYTLQGNGSNGTVCSVDWGDGNNTSVSTSFNIHHEYISPGYYTVTIIGTTPCGIDTVYKYVTVKEPSVNFKYDPFCLGDSVHFYPEVDCLNPSSFHWNFGDGTSSWQSNPVHLYSSSTSYFVTLTVKDKDSISYIVSKYVTHVPQPVLPKVSGYRNICDNDTLVYTINNPNPYYTYNWSVNYAGIFYPSGTSTATGTTVTVYWNDMPNTPLYGELSYAVIDSIGCVNDSAIKVWECCVYDVHGITIWSDDTISTDTIIEGANLMLHGDVLFDANVEFTKLLPDSNSIIFMGPEAKITITDGHELNLNTYSVVREGCQFMWDGIYAFDSTSTVIIDSSFIMDAVNGIVSQNGARIISKNNSEFINNYKAITVKNYSKANTSPHPLDISESHFKCNNSDFLLGFPPYSNIQPFAGIYISQVNNVTVGNPNKAKNTFENLQYGIYARYSYLNVYNNEFDSIFFNSPSGTSAIPSSAAIMHICRPGIRQSEGSPATDPFPILNVGDIGQNHSNKVTNSDFGIFSMYSLVNVINNEIEGTTHGIKLLQPYSNSSVQYNELKTHRSGITADRIFKANRGLNLRIGRNIIENSIYPIWVRNCNSNLALGNFVDVDSNLILRTTSVANKHVGITIEGCDRIFVHKNALKRTSIPIQTDQEKYIGIRIARTQGATIHENVVKYYGSAFYTNGELHYSTFTCNAIDTCWFGFNFGDLTVMSNQGAVPPASTYRKAWYPHNLFTGSYYQNKEKLYCASFGYWNGPNIHWYIGPNTPVGGQFSIDPLNSFAGASINESSSPTNSIHFCDSSSYIIAQAIQDDAIKRDEEYVEILNGINNYVEFEEEFEYFEKEYLYEILESDTTLLYLDPNLDDDFMEFYLYMNSSEMGDLRDIRELIEEGEIERAQELNREVNDLNHLIEGMTDVNDVYLRTFAIDENVLNETEQSILGDIALQLPYWGGDAVYNARAMLGLYEVDEYGLSYRFGSDEVTQESLKVYPNPANNTVTFELDNPLETSVNLRLYNIIGECIYQTQIDESERQIIINVDNFVPGIYLYQVKGYKEWSGKLSIY